MPEITKSRRKLEEWAAIRELDALAKPLIAEYGIVEAYEMAADEMEKAESRCS
jgi:hypothetical protein